MVAGVAGICNATSGLHKHLYAAGLPLVLDQFLLVDES